MTFGQSLTYRTKVEEVMVVMPTTLKAGSVGWHHGLFRAGAAVALLGRCHGGQRVYDGVDRLAVVREVLSIADNRRILSYLV